MRRRLRARVHYFMSSPSAAWSDGVWAAAGVEESQPAPGLRVFSIVDATRHRHRVLVAEGRGDSPLLVAARAWLDECPSTRWHPAVSYDDDRDVRQPNSFSCKYRMTGADRLLGHFNRLEADAMRMVFNVSKPCEYMTDAAAGSGGLQQMAGALQTLLRLRYRRAWVLALHEEMTPDAFHPDGCETTARARGSDLFTVITYPNTREWDASRWGGALLFAPHVCQSEAEGRRASEVLFPGGEGAVLRIAPRADRVIVFSGQLLHRSTPPTAAAPLSTSFAAFNGGVRGGNGQQHAVPREARWRYSSVQQLQCFNNGYHGPYVEGDDADTQGMMRLVALALLVVWFFRRGGRNGE